MQDNEMLDDEQARVLAFEERQMAKVREEAKKPKFPWTKIQIGKKLGKSWELGVSKTDKLLF